MTPAELGFASAVLDQVTSTLREANDAADELIRLRADYAAAVGDAAHLRLVIEKLRAENAALKAAVLA